MAFCKWGSFIVVALTSFLCCIPKIHPYTGEQAFQSVDGIPDYEKLEYWASHPSKWDPADSIPKPLKGMKRNTEVDVFFIHPTTFTDDKSIHIPNAPIDDPLLNSKTDYTSMLYQASVFNANARVFAPRYRQAHIGMYYEKDTTKALRAFEIAYSDVRRAFLKFLEFNGTRPIVIASHSQGTTHAKRLMKEFFDGKTLSDRLVVAYLSGIRVEKAFFAKLAVCGDSNSTGCITSWRTYRVGYEGPYTSLKDTSTVVVNPVNWRIDKEIASRSMHKGAILYTFNKSFRNTHTTQIVGDMVWISRPRFPGAFLYKTKNYHAGDINLFYLDIMADVKRRVDGFMKSKK
jgi:hypothetical protein